MSYKSNLDRWVKNIKIAQASAGNLKIVIYCIIIGLVAGLGAHIFFSLLEWSKLFFQEFLAGRELSAPAGEHYFSIEKKESILHFLNSILPITITVKRIIFFILPAIGGLIGGAIVYKFAPEAEGHGTDAFVDAFHNKNGNVRARVPLVKSIASILTLATGGSGGREGPIAQIGSGFASWFSRVLKLSSRERRLLFLAGAAGGLGAIFRAPLGGALTSVEVLYKEDFESDAIIPSIISSVVAFTLFTALNGHSYIFNIAEELKFSNALELPFYLLLSIFCSVVGIFYIKVFHYSKNSFFANLNIKRHYKPAIGGLFVGFIGLVAPEALGDGWGFIQKALDGEVLIQTFFFIAVFKIFATSFTVGSGGSAGVFGPTLFIGAMLGGGFGTIAHNLFPDIIVNPASFILVGMASFFAGVANAPIASLIMVCELTGGYGLIAPLMLVSVFNIMFLKKFSIYEKQVENKFHSPAHLGDMTVDLLKSLKVGDILKEHKVIYVRPETTIGAFNRVIASSDQSVFPVKTRMEKKYIGMVSLNSVREVMFENDAFGLLIMSDFLVPPESFTKEMTLNEAMALFLKTGHEEIPVISSEDSNIILGTLKYKNIIEAYNSEMGKIKAQIKD